MKTFKSRGTLGDAYIVSCVLHRAASRGPVLIHQCPFWSSESTDDWEPLITQIYSLTPNIEVRYVTKDEFDDLKKVPRVAPSAAKYAADGRKGMNPFPDFKYPDVKGLPDKYLALSPRGGKSNENHRQIGVDEVHSILNKHKDLPIVLVGNNPEYEDIAGPNILNMNGQTSILEAMGIVSRASGFIGVQGLQAYVALGSRVPSAVYTKSVGYDKAFRLRLFPKWEEGCIIYKTHRSEDEQQFADFMRDQYAKIRG